MAIKKNPNTYYQKSVSVLKYRDNPDRTTTNLLSDHTLSTVRYGKNNQPTEVKGNYPGANVGRYA